MADFDVRPFDDDGDDHSNDFNPVTDEGWFVPTDFGALGALYPFFLKHYNEDESAEIGATGTGLFNPFLNMNGDSTLVGFNTNDSINNPTNTALGTDISDPNTDAIQLGDIPIIYRDLDGDGELEAYYVINLDINENVNSEVSLEELQLFTSSAPATIADYHFDEGAALAFEFNGGNAATDFTLRFDLDATGANKFILRDDGAGQGKLDYTFYFPVSMFAGSNPNTYLTLFSQFGPNPADDAGFAEWNTLVAAKITGTKFLDRNGDGVRDADGADNNLATTADNESPLAGFTMYIDLNGNNKLDANEQTALTDANGNFTFGSLLPNASYVVREVLTAADVNGPGDAGTDVNFATYAPPPGAWDQTTDDGTGDQVVNVTTGTTNILVGNQLLTPALSIDKSASVPGDCADTVGELITYTVVLDNVGNVALDNVVLTDAFEGGADVTLTVTGDTNLNTILDVGEVWLSGDTGNDGIMGVNETWTYSYVRAVTQADIDSNGGGDGTLDNLAKGNADAVNSDTAADEVSDDASVDVCQDPALGIAKSATVDGDCVDTVGELVNYTILVSNEGNVGLENVVVTDDMADVGSLDNDADDDGVIDGDIDDDGILDVGETWTYTAFHTVTQDDIDNNGNYDSDLDGINDVLRNVATANADAVTSGEAAEEVTDDATVDVCQDPALGIAKSAVVDGDCVDTVGELVNYTILVTNEGNVSLENVVVTDDMADVGSLDGDADDDGFIDGDADMDGELDVGETWTYTAYHTVTQADIDNNGNFDSDDDGINDVLRNIATANADAVTTGEAAEEVTDDASVDVCQDPALGIAKSATVDGDCVDTVGELVNYTILVSNEGNVGLENVVVTDDMADVGSLDNDADDDGVIDGDTDDDGILDVGETWTYTAYHTVTQADIDSNGNYDSDLDGINDVLRNVATANADAVTSGEAAEEVTDDATVDVCQDPAIDIEKFVRTDVSGVFADEDDPDGPAASTSSTVDFRVTLTNTGNVTLTNITLSDSVIHTVGGIPGAPVNIDYSDPALGAFIDLDGDALLDAGEEWLNFDTDGDGTLDIDENGDPFELSVGETVNIYYSLTAALGQHENTAVVTADAATTGEDATDSDDANYYVLATDDCVGVRTPGFWSNPKWMTFWDAKGDGWGTPANEPIAQAGTPGFADGELLYKVYLSDTNNDTVIDTNDAFSTGLLVGDYNLNGITDAGEDTIFISLPDAIKLINASSKQLSDGKTSDGIYMLGRDTVATWLNYLANNQDTIGECIGEVDSGDGTNAPIEYLDAAIDWFQQFASTTNGNANQNLVNSYHDGDAQALFQFDARIAPSSASWQNAVTQGENIPVSAAQMHSQLDAYNNSGVINGIEYCCDADNSIALHAIGQISLI